MAKLSPTKIGKGYYFDSITTTDGAVYDFAMAGSRGDWHFRIIVLPDGKTLSAKHTVVAHGYAASKSVAVRHASTLLDVALAARCVAA